jgi:hypothetical protein
LTGGNGPAGWQTNPIGVVNVDILPLPGGHPYALVGRIGTGDYFFVGDKLETVQRRRGGRLFLRTNDDMPGNGTGSFSARVRIVHQVRFYVFVGEQLQNQAILDTEGAKNVPGICLSCHGGRYVADSATVAGASFLPFDVFSFHYGASPNTLADQQENFRLLNLLVKKTLPNHANPNNPIVDYINGSYPQGVETQGATAVDTYVPAGWSTKPNVYDAVVKHNCRTCHIALDESLDLISYQNFFGLQGRIQAAVCGSHDMPHAEVPFNKFWRSSPVYLPGYLEDPSVLGVTNCAQPPI